MKKRSLGIFSITIISLLCFYDAFAQEQPNILLIVADDLGYEKVGSYNDLISFTPNIDKLAKQGVMFTRAYASPVCTPSRMSIYTGNYATSHKYTGVLPVHLGTKEYVDFDTKWTTSAQLLRQNGYQTSVTGKWQMAAMEYHPEHCKSAGFDSWCVWQIWHNEKKTTRYWNATINEDGKISTEKDSLFGPEILTDYVIRQMEQSKQLGKPFFIQHNMMLPHVPIVLTPDDKREASLDNMIKYMDKQIGILLDAVDKLEIAKNTIVIFVGDNGTQSEEPRITKSGLINGGKWTLTDGGMHVPLIIRYPDILPENMKYQNLIDMADLFPTICDLSSTKINDATNIDGISFNNLLMGKEQKERKWVTAGYEDDFVIFDGSWRLHQKGNVLVDCRNLPEETISDVQSTEAKDALARLTPLLNELLINK
ncbi:sulfatase-like hydrolase/transferase [uncultured Arcticibacterium sp.]|uniref:sulfatase-like hydrolase/transferase n=1 Tax=uncultured Arcticibacterium sp. TaxID=2173042 RepID=UPI0030FB5BA7